MNINIDQYMKVKEFMSHLKGYNKPCLKINYEHYTKVFFRFLRFAFEIKLMG